MRLLNKDLRLQDVTLIYVILLTALVVLLVAPYHASSPSSSFQATDGPSRPFLPYRMPLDPAGQMELSWNISYTKQEVYMELRVKELRHGVLLGMSDRGEPTNADLMLLWNDGHKSYFG
ncbi:dopamine beta-hydroxylase-like, partial [Clarias magur]